VRLNKFIASGTELSRRAADTAIAAGKVTVNGLPAGQGQDIGPDDVVALDGQEVTHSTPKTTIMLNKPVGFVVSRQGQGSRTIYDILPSEYHQLNPIGRLDKDSSGLLLLTNDGELANALTHPSYQKRKVYEVTLNKPLQPLHRQMISDHGLQLDDGLSKLQLERQQDDNDLAWTVSMHEGRNRQIRRTFDALGYNVVKLHRLQIGDYTLGNLPQGTTRKI
jgi:23S rRNA pseudouridine2605 synthase